MGNLNGGVGWGAGLGLKGDITVNRALSKQCPHHSVDRGGGEGRLVPPHSWPPFPCS